MDSEEIINVCCFKSLYFGRGAGGGAVVTQHYCGNKWDVLTCNNLKDISLSHKSKSQENDYRMIALCKTKSDSYFENKM